MEAINRDFGSFDNFRTQMSAKTVAIQGSGWGWLVSEFCQWSIQHFVLVTGIEGRGGEGGGVVRLWVLLSNFAYGVLDPLV